MKKSNLLGIIKKIKEEYPLVLMYLGGNFLNAIFLRLFTSGHFHLRGVFFDFAFLMLMVAISFLIKKKRRKMFYIITSFIMVIICMVNSLYYNYYGSFVSVSLISTSVFVKDVGDAVMDMVVRPCDLTYLWILIVFLFVYRKKTEKSESNKNYFKKSFLIGFICLAIGSSLPPYYAFSRLYKLWNRISVVDYFGPYVYQIDDIVQSLKPAFNNIFGYDKALKDTKDYYENNKLKVVKNKYTGILDGKNVIVIHAESLQSFVIGLKFNGKEVTPNLNKLVNEGLYFNNFYAQVGVGTSSDTEFTYATSLLPANNGTVFVNYFNNKFITMQHLLKDKGYYVFSMHGNVGDFWNRDTMHMNMGYDKFYSKSSFVIDEEYGLGLSDESFFRQAVPMIKEIKNEIDKPFYGTLITLTNHTPWRDADKYGTLDVSLTVDVDGVSVKRDYLENTLMGRYLKSVNYMDKAIGEFITNLENEGLLDDTVIVIYGDHDARIDKKQFNYMYNYDPVSDTLLEEDSENYKEFNDYDYELSKKVPFIIWNSGVEAVTIDKPMGMIDVMPTLGNMLGVYNKYALGKDIMNVSKKDAIVVFKDGSYLTDKIYYSAKNSSAYTISNGVINEKYIDSRSKYAEEIVEISDNIIIYDLIDKLK